jgi:hypothetical protein
MLVIASAQASAAAQSAMTARGGFSVFAAANFDARSQMTATGRLIWEDTTGSSGVWTDQNTDNEIWTTKPTGGTAWE